MKVSEEMLMAYVDGELDHAAAESVERAMHEDPQVARAVAAARRLRQRVRAAYEPVAREDVPPRLLATARSSTLRPPARRTRHRVQWPEWTALAASLAVGFLLASWLSPTRTPELQLAAGGLRAGDALARVLDRGLASAAPTGPIVPGLSFRSRDGHYCRTFILREPDGGVSGLACREGEEWKVQVVAAMGNEAGELRLATSSLPPAVLMEVDQRIDGEPLDAAGEHRAREAGWR